TIIFFLSLINEYLLLFFDRRYLINIFFLMGIKSLILLILTTSIIYRLLLLLNYLTPFTSLKYKYSKIEGCVLNWDLPFGESFSLTLPPINKGILFLSIGIPFAICKNG